eukprot:SAG11_NODE_1721_length_4374_cov_5.296374_1_plen_263_part_00
MWDRGLRESFLRTEVRFSTNLQPIHLKLAAATSSGADALRRVCELALNGDVPPAAAAWLYDHKIVAFDKMPQHQADIHRRSVAAALAAGLPPPKPKLRPIAIGEAILRLAERTYCRQLKPELARHLMPFQFGVAVPGGLSLWSTVVEAMQQLDTTLHFLSIDLTNCFNAMDRDALIRECLRHEPLRPLARYVASAYPRGMIAWVEVERAWQAVDFANGTAQGRPLSPALAAILLQPALQAAREHPPPIYVIYREFCWKVIYC